MRRFALATRRVTAVTSPVRLCFRAASAPASNPVAAPETTTAREPQPRQKENVLNVPSMTLAQLLTSVVGEMQKKSLTPTVHENVIQKKTEGSSEEAAKDASKEAKAGLLPYKLSPEKFIMAISTYIRREEEMALMSRSNFVAMRRQYLMLRAKQPRLSSSQRDILLHEASCIVEKREVPLNVAARLLRPRWPNYFMDVVGVRHHAFLVQSLRGWTVELIRDGKLTAKEARRFLMQCPRLFFGQVSLMGSVVECALSDLNTIDDPELLIKLMWSVNNAKTHAPDHFWRRIVDKLAMLNRSMRDQVGDAIRIEKGKDEKKSEEEVTEANSVMVGHVFSGLTTRQLFRILRVLRKERWCGDVPVIFDFMDKALKNIVFEVEATQVADTKSSEDLPSRRTLVQRVKKASDLSPVELLSLLSIAGELGADFHVPLACLSEYLLSPMARYLDRDHLLLLTTCVRRTRCDSAQLVQTIVDTIVRRGVTYSSSLALTKAVLRTILQKPALLSHLTLAPFMDHIFYLCDTHKRHLRAPQILAWVELLYALSRLYAPSSSVGVRVRAAVESFADPLIAMLAIEVVPISIVSRMLEYTVILGMRKQPQYPLTAKLWEDRNTLVNGRRAHADSLGGGDENDTASPDHGPEEDVTSETMEMEEVPKGEVTKSVKRVYDELISVYERQTVMQMPLLKGEKERVCETFQRVGLYSIFMGADIMKQLHLRDAASTSSAPTLRHRALSSRPLSTWIEQNVASIVDTRIRSAKISPESTDNDVLRLFGHRHCDAAKVRRFQVLLMSSPLLLARERRSLWEYTSELARRFGGAQEKSLAEEMLRKALH
ncbi:putative mitochondrial RNA binding protein [Trypanosoma cruzi]|uniref:Putative mitochondrial RNA binding protein n=1 Tax=Trypanosoma cruzi TaxID=5693 RepID=A0A2V2V6W5_TRYCR|nr:putative mitochondrial RNA binding protein [Trypanosoma cruzi]RNF23413.1 putative mitochondrial RNA binding protein [Trypanosoma cruzi]